MRLEGRAENRKKEDKDEWEWTDIDGKEAGKERIEDRQAINERERCEEKEKRMEKDTSFLSADVRIAVCSYLPDEMDPDDHGTLPLSTGKLLAFDGFHLSRQG